MQDGIIKGTGNSRFLKSVPDFLTQYPTYESFVAALAAGTLPVDFNGINETGWQQLGTALNKGTLLSDKTAAALGLPNTETPDEALARIALRAPIGTVLWYTAQKAPDGYLICDGAAVSRTDYADLFAVIGTTFGAGNGSTTFQLPDLRAAFIRGAGSQNGYSATFGQKQDATGVRIASYSYASPMGNIVTNADKSLGMPGYAAPSNQSASEQGGYQAVRPYNIALTPIIKY